MVVHPLREIGEDRRWARYERMRAEPEIVPTSCILCSAINRASERSFVCLWPLEYRSMVHLAV